jgi:hypothetical protein
MTIPGRRCYMSDTPDTPEPVDPDAPDPEPEPETQP